MKNIRKMLLSALLGGVIICTGGCKSMDKSLKSIEGKVGVFAVISTNKGDMILELYYKDAPLTVTNFVGLAEGTLDAAKGKPFYDGLKFHRVIADFMIQGGDPKGNGTGGPGYQFEDEFNDKYQFDGPGVLAMANAGPGTNGSQFFITHVATPWLNNHHTIFGHIVDDASQLTVNAIAQGDVIKSVKIYRQGDEAEKFSATQKDFDLLKKLAKENALAKKRALLAEKIAEVEKAFPDFSQDENGIYYKIIKEGSGEKVGQRKNVTTEYKGYFVNGDVFDGSSKLVKGGHEALSFVTGANQMISGFDVMVQDMKKGELRSFVLPPDMAYGERGAGGVIPPNSFIAFDVEITSVN